MQAVEEEKDLFTNCCSTIIKQLHENPNYDGLFDGLNVFHKYQPNHLKVTTLVNLAIDEILTYKPIKNIKLYSVIQFLENIEQKNTQYEDYLYYVKIVKRLENYIKSKYTRHFYVLRYIILMPTTEYQFHFSANKKQLARIAYETVSSASHIDMGTHFFIMILKKSMEYFNFPSDLIEWIIDNKYTYNHLIIGYIGDELYYDLNPKETLKKFTNGKYDTTPLMKIKGDMCQDRIDICYSYGNNKSILIKKIKINMFLNRSVKKIILDYFAFDPNKYAMPLELSYVNNEDENEEGKEWKNR
jgi:hypothetical protein